MGIQIEWRSQQGTLTPDTRDFCGVGLREDGAFFILLDGGATAGADSGQLACAIANDLVDWFMQTGQYSPDAISGQLRSMHGAFSSRFRDGSASYVITITDGRGMATLLHAGDCMAGQYEAGKAIK